MTKEYTFRTGARVANVKAQAVGKELDRIRARDGQLKTEVVVTEAKKVKNPLHPAFEWNDQLAAHEHRLNQARLLIRSIRVIGPEKEDRPAFVHVTIKHQEEKDSYYQDPEIVVQNVDEFAHAMREAVSKLEGAKSAVRDLESLAERDKDGDRMTMIAIAIKSLETASSALGCMQ